MKVKCYLCGTEFEASQAPEDCVEYNRSHFGKDVVASDLRPICERCFDLVDPDANPHLVEEACADKTRKGKAK